MQKQQQKKKFTPEKELLKMHLKESNYTDTEINTGHTVNICNIFCTDFIPIRGSLFTGTSLAQQSGAISASLQHLYRALEFKVHFGLFVARS